MSGKEAGVGPDRLRQFQQLMRDSLARFHGEGMEWVHEARLGNIIHASGFSDVLVHSKLPVVLKSVPGIEGDCSYNCWHWRLLPGASSGPAPHAGLQRPAVPSSAAAQVAARDPALRRLVFAAIRAHADGEDGGGWRKQEYIDKAVSNADARHLLRGEKYTAVLGCMHAELERRNVATLWQWRLRPGAEVVSDVNSNSAAITVASATNGTPVARLPSLPSPTALTRPVLSVPLNTAAASIGTLVDPTLRETVLETVRSGASSSASAGGWVKQVKVDQAVRKAGLKALMQGKKYAEILSCMPELEGRVAEFGLWEWRLKPVSPSSSAGSSLAPLKSAGKPYVAPAVPASSNKPASAASSAAAMTSPASSDEQGVNVNPAVASASRQILRTAALVGSSTDGWVSLSTFEALLAAEGVRHLCGSEHLVAVLARLTFVMVGASAAGELQFRLRDVDPSPLATTSSSASSSSVASRAPSLSSAAAISMQQRPAAAASRNSSSAPPPAAAAAVNAASLQTMGDAFVAVLKGGRVSNPAISHGWANAASVGQALRAHLRATGHGELVAALPKLSDLYVRAGLESLGVARRMDPLHSWMYRLDDGRDVAATPPISTQGNGAQPQHEFFGIQEAPPQPPPSKAAASSSLSPSSASYYDAAVYGLHSEDADDEEGYDYAYDDNSIPPAPVGVTIGEALSGENLKEAIVAVLTQRSREGFYTPLKLLLRLLGPVGLPADADAASLHSLVLSVPGVQLRPRSERQGVPTYFLPLPGYPRPYWPKVELQEGADLLREVAACLRTQHAIWVSPTMVWTDLKISRGVEAASTAVAAALRALVERYHPQEVQLRQLQSARPGSAAVLLSYRWIAKD